LSEIIVRFAPSPTGYLHVGGARTALFNWLFARHHGGKFLLRIEDTDRERSSSQAVEAIFEGLRWLGLNWDGEPLFQSSRLEQHRDLVMQLLERGAAYRCFCDPQELSRRQQDSENAGNSWRYPGACRDVPPDEVANRLNQGQVFAIRFRTPPGTTAFDDAVHGEISVKNADIEDFVLLRRDGTPVYNVAVVADDSFMGITHVVRGDDHISNTPKQILIYRALGWPAPRFAHVPLILGPDKKRLSKRHGATAVTDYRQMGILPEAMRNFLALLGWNPGGDREIMNLDELMQAFSLEGINPSGAVFDFTKLEWMNGRYIAMKSALKIWEGIKPFILSWCVREGVRPPNEALGLKLAVLLKDRLRRWTEAPEMVEYFLRDPVHFDEKGMKKFWKPETPGQLLRMQQELEKLQDWNATSLEAAFDQVAGELGLKRADLIHPVRLGLTGRTATPGIFEVMEILEKETCLRRLKTLLHGQD
jgi:glutamyl-tRNA synthetase